MSSITTREILKHAIRMEEKGARFYSETAQRIEDKKASETFSRLAADESCHKARYEAMVARLPETVQTNSFPSEFIDYFLNYIDTYNQFNSQNQLSDKGVDLVTAINFALKVECDFILLYRELKQLVPADDNGVIDEIISEEQWHFKVLSEMKKSLS